MRFVPALVASATLGCALVASGEAWAETAGQDVATAQALFDDGKRLMQLGKYGEACPKLVESQRLDPAGGTRLAIGLCHEGEGRTATAWADFNLALTEARRDRRSDRETAATDHIRALEKRMTRVTISVDEKLDGLEIRRDGAVVGEAQWSTPLPIDPGEHRFEARAPGRTTWQRVVAIGGEGAIVDVKVPALERAPVAPAESLAPPASASPPAVVVAPSAAPSPRPHDEKSSRGAYMTWAAITGGVGLVATGVGVAFGISASSRWSDAKRACPNGGCANPNDVARASDAGHAADMSTVFVFVGGAGLATAAVLFFTAPSDDARTSARALRVTPLVGYGNAGVAVGGRL
jgi:hypothetical protein